MNSRKRNILKLNDTFTLIPREIITSVLTYFDGKRELKHHKWELLGDKILGLSLCKYLINTSDDTSIGALTKRISYLVGRENLKLIITDLGFKPAKIWSTKKYGDLLETFIGLSYTINETWTELFLIELWNKYTNLYNEAISNPKGLLQEILIMKKIRYKYVRLSTGESIIVKLNIDDNSYYGRARNAKDAEKRAALKALKQWAPSDNNR